MAIGDDLMYVDNDKDEDQDFTAMKEPDQKKRYVLLMKSMIRRMIYLTSIDIYELDNKVSDQSTIQSKVFYNLNITSQIINQMEQLLLLQITCLDKKNMWSGKNTWQILKTPKILYQPILMEDVLRFK